jgi:hypothetical protein
VCSVLLSPALGVSKRDVDCFDWEMRGFAGVAEDKG